MAFILKTEMSNLITKGSVKTNYLDKKQDRWNNNTAKFKTYLEKKGFVNGKDFKIENLSQPSNCKQRFIWIKNK
ncbi:hypothetical protein V3471_15525 [Flavobacterium oreochromis]|uniref:hypothetical protein n=1 Tax=Flavobacterium oreochromis TaxID=2906078 RepID=UPI00385F0C94